LQQHSKVPARFYLFLQLLGPVASSPVGLCLFLQQIRPTECLATDLVPHEVSSPL
ncbi:hypothetical protein BGZ95_010602, partial [Linnemannia exigua]